ncbi:MAG: STAS domain-containing protein [Candidatus Kapabacteria bacterium]|nr:STAS domain-containing protein [Candidatus Kapabacteria bacterium]
MFEHIKLEHREGVEVIELHGQFIGGEETDQLRETLGSIAQQETNKLIINLGGVSYLNSTALGVLISSHANFAKRNGRIALCNISKSIENIFVITKLTLVFEIHSTLDEAITSFSNI